METAIGPGLDRLSCQMNSRNPRRSKLEKGALLFYVLPTELFENYSKNRFEWISKENSALSLTVAARERKVIVQL